ncbi:MAG TPA: hypothetical protein VHP63_05720 [candidate division Zixibacteria bacterium]|nr:hypothetical protein [candidate division Zixibacteria bacterium]
MKKGIMKRIGLLLVLLFLWQTGFSRNLVLVEFKTNSYDSTLSWLSKIENDGVTAYHIFPPNLAIVDVYDLPRNYLENYDNKWTVHDNADILGNSNLLDGHPARAAYLHIIGDRTLELPPAGARFNCPPPPDFIGRDIQTDISNRLTGQFLIGYIAVGIYLMESNGSQENWYPAAEQQTFNEIVEGLDWLGQQGFQRGAKVVWVYAPVETVPTNYEPITGLHMPSNGNFNWLNDIYTTHELPNDWDGAFALANLLRKVYKANWAVEITVVMDNNDPNHMFSDDYFAYTSHYSGSSDGRSPIVVMTYNNDGYSPVSMSSVIAHEISHVFGTSDEYSGPSKCDEQSDCGVQQSYLQTNNGNCEVCNSNSVSCYMQSQPGYVCTFTPPELGWRDSEGDGPMDPIDQNYAHFMWIQPVAAGDLLQIYNSLGQFINIISVSPDMLCGVSNNAIFWNGVQWNNNQSANGVYPVKKNGNTFDSFILSSSPSADPFFTLHHYLWHDTLNYYNEEFTLNIRNTIYDSLGNIFSRPRFDVMTNDHDTIKTPMFGIPDGIYTSKVFGWRSDGLLSELNVATFINYLCGDANNNYTFNSVDLNFVVNRIFRGGPPPPHPASADVNCDGISCNIVDLNVFVNYFYHSGPDPVCCHTLP